MQSPELRFVRDLLTLLYAYVNKGPILTELEARVSKSIPLGDLPFIYQDWDEAKAQVVAYAWLPLSTRRY